MPFIFTNDQRSIRIGNPTLAPEFSNLAEVNHLLPFGKNGNDWLTSIYTRITEDVISSYAYTDPLNPDILVISYLNGETSYNYGWENTLRLRPSKQYDITLSSNVQWVDISLRTEQDFIKNTGINWSGKAAIKYRFQKDLSIQANGRFQGPRILPQGERQAQYTLDLSVNKRIKRKWDFTVSLRDVFNSRYSWTVYDTPAFYQESRRRRDIRHLMFSATYRFGESDGSLFRRRSGPSQRREPGKDSDGGEGF
jgi:outer membrane receptor for ferrienterochelin and colicin